MDEALERIIREAFEDLDGSDVWRRVLKAIKEIRR